MSLNDFEQVKELGKGAFGTVTLVKRISDSTMYAMKTVKIAKMNAKDRENALNEVRMLASVRHQNIIDFKDAFFDEESLTLNIIMEVAEEGDLASKIKKHRNIKTLINESEIWSYLIQIIQGLQALHEKKIMHRDLKSANVFLNKSGVIKLGDLNVSKVAKMGLCYTQTGTPYYASPEVWSEKPYDYKSDIWSVGCIIYELCTTRPPFRAQSLEQLFKCVCRGAYDPISSTYSKDLHNMISQLLQVDPKKRPSCSQLLELPIIKDKIKNANLSMTKCEGTLLNTIKVPPKLNDINFLLPKMKRYNFTLNNKDSPMKKAFALKVEVTTTPLKKQTSDDHSSHNTSASSNNSGCRQLIVNKLRKCQSKSPTTERGSSSSNSVLELSSHSKQNLNIPPRRKVNNPIINLIRPVSQCPKQKNIVIRDVSVDLPAKHKENINPNSQIKLKRIESGKPRIYINLCEPVQAKKPTVPISNFLNCKPVSKKL
jgi:serine/threonine protein kinase